MKRSHDLGPYDWTVSVPLAMAQPARPLSVCLEQNCGVQVRPKFTEALRRRYWSENVGGCPVRRIKGKPEVPVPVMRMGSAAWLGFRLKARSTNFGIIMIGLDQLAPFQFLRVQWIEILLVLCHLKLIRQLPQA